MEEIQYCLINKLLAGNLNIIECEFNAITKKYLNELKQAYDDFIFLTGRGAEIDKIVDAYENFYLMIDSRIMCLFNVAYTCRDELQVVLYRKETFANLSVKECFCLLRNYMFRL